MPYQRAIHQLDTQNSKSYLKDIVYLQLNNGNHFASIHLFLNVAILCTVDSFHQRCFRCYDISMKGSLWEIIFRRFAILIGPLKLKCCCANLIKMIFFESVFSFLSPHISNRVTLFVFQECLSLRSWIGRM